MRSEDYSGSDLREVVRVALLQRTKRDLKAASREQQVAKAVYDRQVLEWQAKQDSSSNGTSSGGSGGSAAEKDSGAPTMKTVLPRRTAVQLEDFDYALTKALPTGTAANDYARELGELKRGLW
jgi:SpoVK/Ycf46/Vps4 family AAA+-type ATPase